MLGLGWPWRLSRSTTTGSWGRTPPVWGSRPPSKAAPGQLPPGVGLASATTTAIVGGGRAGQGFQGGQQGLAGLGLQQPVQGDHAVPG